MIDKILTATIAIVSLLVTTVFLFVEIDGKKVLSIQKAAALYICIFIFVLCVVFLSFWNKNKSSENTDPVPTPEVSEQALPVDPTSTPAPTSEPTSEPTPDPTPESTPEPTNPRYLNVQCQNDPSFTDFYVELTSPNGQQPNYYFSSDLPVRLPDVSGTYSILIFHLTGKLLYGNSTYIHDFADGWNVYFPYEIPEEETTYSVYFGYPDDYSGNMTADPWTAHCGDEVSVTFDPLPDNMSVTIQDELGNPVSTYLENGQFIFLMPACNVHAIAQYVY